MASIIRSVSLSQEEVSFLEDKNLSITALLKSKLGEAMEYARQFSEKRVLETERKLKAFMDLAYKYRDFIEKEGLLDKYLKENE